MTLRIGDRLYTQSGFIPHSVHHPHRALTSSVGQMLRTAYVTAHRHGRTRLTQSNGHNYLSMSTDSSLPRNVIPSGSWVGIFKGYSLVPRETSHITVFMAFIVAPFQRATVRHRVTLIDSLSVSDQRTVQYEVEEIQTVGAPSLGSPSGDTIGDQFMVKLVAVRLALSNVSTQTPGVCEIRAEVDPDFPYLSVWGAVRSESADFDTALVDTAEGATTLSPFRLASAEDVVFEDLRRIKRMADWAIIYRPQNILSLATAMAGWDDYAGGSSSAPATWDLSPGAGLERVISTDHWTSVETSNGQLLVGSECNVPIGSTVTVTFTATGGLGATSASVVCTNANNGSEVASTLSLAAVTAGEEWVLVEVEMQRSAGAGTCDLRTIRVDEDELPGVNPPADD